MSSPLSNWINKTINRCAHQSFSFLSIWKIITLDCACLLTIEKKKFPKELSSSTSSILSFIVLVMKIYINTSWNEAVSNTFWPTGIISFHSNEQTHDNETASKLKATMTACFLNLELPVATVCLQHVCSDDIKQSRKIRLDSWNKTLQPSRDWSGNVLLHFSDIAATVDCRYMFVVLSSY